MFAASVITWVVETGTALLTLLLCVALLVVASPLFKTFEPGTGNPRWIPLEGTAIVWALAGAADVAAVLILRRSRWARWVPAGLSLVAGFLGLVGIYYVVPLAVTAAAVAVVVVLFTPTSRAWFRTGTEALAPR